MPSGSSALKILPFSSQHLLHDEFFDVVLFVCDVGEPVLGSLFWGAVVTNRAYLFVICLYFCLPITAGARAGLPLALLAGSSLLLGTIASNMPLSVTIETDDFPDVVLGSFWIGDCLAPSVSSWHEILRLR